MVLDIRNYYLDTAYKIFFIQDNLLTINQNTLYDPYSVHKFYYCVNNNGFCMIRTRVHVFKLLTNFTLQDLLVKINIEFIGNLMSLQFSVSNKGIFDARKINFVTHRMHKR